MKWKFKMLLFGNLILLVKALEIFKSINILAGLYFLLLFGFKLILSTSLEVLTIYIFFT